MFARNLLFIDIGNFYLKGIVINEKKYEIIAQHIIQNTGISNGYITNTNKFNQAIYDLVKELEKQSKIVAKNIILIVNGKIINYKMLISNSIKVNGFVDQKKIDIIDAKINIWIKQNKSLLIKSIPIKYILDGSNITQPFGLFAENIKCLYFLAYSKINLLGNIVHSIERMNLNIIDIMPSIYCNAYSYLTDDEKELGALIFDIGATSINWAHYKYNNPTSAGSINIGSEFITQKIAKNFNISLKEARNIKKEYASASLLPEHFCAWVEIHKDINPEFILQSEVIRKVLPEIEIITNEIKKIMNNFKHQTHIAVLCGAGSWLHGLCDALEKNTSLKIKLTPSQDPIMDSLNSAIKFYKFHKENEKSLIQSAISWLKNNI